MKPDLEARPRSLARPQRQLPQAVCCLRLGGDSSQRKFACSSLFEEGRLRAGCCALEAPVTSSGWLLSVWQSFSVTILYWYGAGFQPHGCLRARQRRQCQAARRAAPDPTLAQVPHEGKIYAFNEGNYQGWEPGLREYMDSLKDAGKWGGKPYSARRAPIGLEVRPYDHAAACCAVVGCLAALRGPWLPSWMIPLRSARCLPH